MYCIIHVYSPENSPENHWLEDAFPIEIVFFRGHVSFRGFIICLKKKTTIHDPSHPSEVPETQSCQSVQSASKCGGPSRGRRPKQGHSPPNVS